MYKKIIFPKQILILLALTVVLNIARLSIFNSSYFVYLLWNLFLALLPFVVSAILLSLFTKHTLSKPLLSIGGIVWLLLLPNAPYIVTDLIHLGRSTSAPLLYDTFLIFSCAWVALLLGFYSLLHMETIIKSKYTARKTASIMALIILLTSFGMYIGRFLRFNSWDIVSDTVFFFKKIFSIFAHPQAHSDAYLFTGLSFIFIYLSYRAWKLGQRDTENLR